LVQTSKTDGLKFYFLFLKYRASILLAFFIDFSTPGDIIREIGNLTLDKHDGQMLLTFSTPIIRDISYSEEKNILRSTMEHQEEIDQFKILEEKIGILIGKVSSLKDEKESIITKVREQDRVIADLKGELDNIKTTRDKTRVRIQSILDKINKMDL
jgi:FtsZ-binding cell division protein ZapB